MSYVSIPFCGISNSCFRCNKTSYFNCFARSRVPYTFFIDPKYTTDEFVSLNVLKSLRLCRCPFSFLFSIFSVTTWVEQHLIFVVVKDQQWTRRAYLGPTLTYQWDNADKTGKLTSVRSDKMSSVDFFFARFEFPTVDRKSGEKSEIAHYRYFQYIVNTHSRTT